MLLSNLFSYLWRIIFVVGIAALAILTMPSERMEAASKRKSKPKVKPPIAASAELDKDAKVFEDQTALIHNARECFPVHIREKSNVGILYVYCSDEAFDADGQSVDITANFTVPRGIARRYNFWRRVYSLWSKDQYLLHSAEYPEVIFEVLDLARVTHDMGDMARAKFVNKISKSERNEYRQVLLTMHQYRNQPLTTLSPAMQRIARSMRHIQDPNKYFKAAQALRTQRGQRDFIAKGLEVGPKYLPYIEQEFQAQGIPRELAKLAYIESSFNLLARSKVGASGVFQIMPETGRQYMIVKDGVDERNDPIKASRAAAKLLRFNFRMLGSWPLAITAYNHGANGLQRAVRATGSNNLVFLINHYTGVNFQFASKNFYSGFLGLLATLQESDRIFPEIPKATPLSFENIKLTKSSNISELKKRYNLTNDELIALNADMTRAFIKRGEALPKGYVLKVPPRGTNSSDKFMLTSFKRH